MIALSFLGCESMFSAPAMIIQFPSYSLLHDWLASCSTVQRWLTTAPGFPTTHWYQLRCVLSQPLYVLAGQPITGRLHLIAHSSQSYTIHLTMNGKLSILVCTPTLSAFFGTFQLTANDNRGKLL